MHWMTPSDQELIDEIATPLLEGESDEDKFRSLSRRFGQEQLIDLYWKMIRQKVYGYDLKGLGLSDRQLARVIKIHLITDNKIVSGSITIIPSLLVGFENPTLGYETFVWCVGNTENWWLQRYFVRNYFSAEEQQIQRDRERKDQNLSAERKAFRRKEVKRKLSLHRKKCVDRTRHIQSLESLSPLEKVEIVVADFKHQPYYYPTSFVDIGAENLRQLSPETRRILMERLRYPPRGPWKSTVKRVRESLKHL